jgi:AraC-like DNA-binding protein
MKDLRSALLKAIERCCPGDGFHRTPVPGVACIKFSRISPRRAKSRWRAAFGIVAQGQKEVVLGRRVYRIDGAHYVATPIDLPVVSRIASATPAQPFLSLLIGIDPATLSEVAAQFSREPEKKPQPAQRALFVGKVTGEMLEAAVRLTKLFASPADAPVLGPLIIKELLYYLLKGNDGRAIRNFVHSGSRLHRIFECIHGMRSELSGEVDVVELARAANMSRSALFKQFRDVTAMSPIQYQKRLRLLEARRLMIDEGETAESSAYKVGYNSASQFSREYSRMFGNAPVRETTRHKRIAS